ISLHKLDNIFFFFISFHSSLFFFFSSRRRHTRFSRDWSSDVCSSDLEDSVAERDWEDWVLQQEGRSRAKAGTLYDARVIPADVDWANPDELRKGLEFVYDDCYWAPIDSIIDEIYSRVSEDPAKSTLDESMRKYGNRPTARSNAWVTKEQWERLAADGHTELGHQPYRRAKPGEEIVMFFDGSLSRDASALIGCCVEDGHVFTLG